MAPVIGEGRFDLIVDSVLRSYRRWEDLPAAFDHVVRFEPELAPGPHSEEQHEAAALWNAKLQELMKIERAGSTTVFVNGKGAGRVGDAISGCTSVAARSPNVFCGP